MIKKRLFISNIHINSQFIKAQRDTVIPQNNDLHDIIKFNIKYILNLFFENGNNIMLSGSKYTSIGYNWNNKFSIKNIYNGEIYSITIDIQLMKNYETSFLDFTSDGCSKKYNNILKHYYSLIRKKGEVKANELTANELKANELKANELKANELKANELKANELKANELKANELKENELKANELKENELGKNVAYTHAKGGRRSSSSSKHNRKKRKGQNLNHRRMTKKITRKSTRKSTRRSHNK